MTSPVRLTAQAEADIAQARDWYENHKAGLGVQFVESVDKAIHRIAENPTLYAPLIEDVRRVNVRTFPYGVWYRVEPDGSVVVACLHHRRHTKLSKERALRRL